MGQSLTEFGHVRRVTPHASAAPPIVPATHRPVTAAERQLVRWLLRALGDPPVRFALWNGEEIGAPREDAVATVQIRDPGALRRLAVHPDLYFGEDYTAARIEVEGSLVELFEAIYRAAERAPRPGWLQRGLHAVLNRPRRNTLDGSRENIHHHYDLGNDFYRLWLDREMVYTCAYFPAASMSLEQAQAAKMDHVCRKLDLRPGQAVVEAGCGWGALARHMARHYGVTVKAFNISSEQVAWARARAEEEGLADRVEYVEDDYRNINGRYDAFVSIGMLEHVGVEHYETLGAMARSVLRANGRGLIHTIGRNRPGTLSAWIERRIFPGAQPPALSEMMQIFEPNDLSVLDVENLRPHYAKTLAHWLARFEASAERIEALTDASFVRAWRMYLSGSVAAFSSGDLQLFQVLFSPGASNEIPWTRWRVYNDAGGAGNRGIV